jgi:hypothetical protein
MPHPGQLHNLGSHAAPHLFNAEDLFLVGVALDMAGGYLLARGLLQTVRQLAKAGGTVWALEKPRQPEAVEDWCRALLGLGTLGAGFLVQAAGYTIALADGRISFHSGWRQALTGVALAVVAILLVLLLDRLMRPRLRDRKLVRVARFDATINGLRPQPLARLLRSYGEEMDKPKLDGEGDVTYCSRVFKVDAVEEWPQPPAG